jgi:hypothetical protein
MTPPADSPAPEEGGQAAYDLRYEEEETTDPTRWSDERLCRAICGSAGYLEAEVE